MTTNPKLAALLTESGLILESTRDAILAHIEREDATALSDARNAALEEAASYVQHHRSGSAFRLIADEIRALKTGGAR